ncbi:probable nucleoporin Nup54 [Cryptotermes secundus]|uniref:probable nucleoporin Nup54 n=1 Tax=Cryptotermes secundus TaxID=105785 RepID=UPI000CD7DE27|nr:probable nucleoporin Nup54 [Cryptotermes secundus]
MIRSFGAFGTGTGGSAFGQYLTQPQQQVPPSPLEALHNAALNCSVYEDERDTTLARWNLLQALWATGKAYYSQMALPVQLTQQNPLCRFKAIGYSCMPSSDNAQGLVAITFYRKEIEIRSQQAQLISGLNMVLHQLLSLGADSVFAQVAPDKDQIKEYLENPPAGIDPRLWKQAQLDNPNPEKYNSVPVTAFGEMRMQRQEAAHGEFERYSMDPSVQEYIKQFLVMKQKGMVRLTDTIQTDLATLKIIKEGITRLLQER